MPSQEIEEFAKKLIQTVRDRAIRSCDQALQPNAGDPIAKRWKRFRAPPEEVKRIVVDTVDEVLFCLLNAIDNSELNISYTAENGKPVNLPEEGLSELAGWYVSLEGWRAEFSSERFFDVLEGDEESAGEPPT